MNAPRPTHLPLLFVAWSLLGFGPPAPAEETEGSYGFVRVLEGSATIIQAETGSRTPAEVHFPLLVGDRLWVPPGSRVEIVLSDRNRLRLDGKTEVVFETLAFSPDGEDEITTLRLLRGSLQLVAVEDALGQELPSVLTGNATLYIHEPGTYLVRAESDDWTLVTTRQGYAKVLTQQGSSVVVRVGEEAVVEGYQWPRIRVRLASQKDAFEHWAWDLELRQAAVGVPHVDDSLQYAATPLDEYGEWVGVAGGPAWRPYAAASDWYPYWHGRWAYTPSGLTWVSSEPWGWVPYHYGTWNLHPLHGWLWYPGSVYAPAHVYWYWGPKYVAWIPSGYYSHYYAPYYPRFHFGFHFGFVWGYAAGSWRHYRHWTFCPTRHFGHHHQRRHHSHGHAVATTAHTPEIEQGIITTDTRRLTPRRWRNAEEVERVLRTQGGARRATAAAGRDLPDVTPFVARKPTLPRDLEERFAKLSAGSRGLGRITRSVPEAPSASSDGPSRRLVPSAPHRADASRKVKTVSSRQPSRPVAASRRLPEAPRTPPGTRTLSTTLPSDPAPSTPEIVRPLRRSGTRPASEPRRPTTRREPTRELHPNHPAKNVERRAPQTPSRKMTAPRVTPPRRATAGTRESATPRTSRRTPTPPSRPVTRPREPAPKSRGTGAVRATPRATRPAARTPAPRPRTPTPVTRPTAPRSSSRGTRATTRAPSPRRPAARPSSPPGSRRISSARGSRPASGRTSSGTRSRATSRGSSGGSRARPRN